jgi:hypothetical protein
MAARYILAVLSLVFLSAALLRSGRVGFSHPQVRTWILVGLIFAVVSAWLFSRS